MRMSRHFGETLRDAPSEADTSGHQLLMRAGYVRPLAAGIHSYLPLGWRSLRKIEAVLRAEMETLGGEEVSMPVVHPAEVWRESGRWYEIGDEMARFTDRAGRDMVLAMTHEEIAAALARREVRSYRQLPMLLFQIQTKFRDEPRPRAGLIRGREFLMKDSYSLDADAAGLEEQYRRHYEAYLRIFRRLGLPDVLAVQSDAGMMGGKVAHEFMVLTDIGEDTLVLCDACGAAANLQVASFRKPTPDPEPSLPLQRVATPGTTSIESLAAFLGVAPSRTAKAVFFTAAIPDPSREGHATRDVLVMALVRGDMDVNETKLANGIQARSLRAATDEEIRAVGAVPGYASPIGIRRGNALVVVDDLLPRSANLVSGANEPDAHYLNVNVGRDFTPDLAVDIASAASGAPCAACGAPLRLARGVEVANIFQLGTRYSEALGATYKDDSGQERPIVMGSYGIGVSRCLACLAEIHHDERGLRLPITVAPYEVALVNLGDRDPELSAQAEALYAALIASGTDVLYDDRDATAGVKFADADLIGAPLRVTVSTRARKAGGVEVKRRDRTEARIVPPEAVEDSIRTELTALRRDVCGEA